MDAKRFDAITRLAAEASRRRVLKGVVGGLLGSGGLLRGWGEVAAGPYDDRGQRCSPTQPCNAPCRACCPSPGGGSRCVYGCDNATQVCDASSGRCVARIGGAPADPQCPS
jgi:hypothetical protein